MAMILTRPLREEHQQLRPRLEVLKRAADAIGQAPAGQLAEFLDPAIAFLQGRLLPHARAEDEILYPVVTRLLGSRHLVEAMRHDHREMARLAGDLVTIRGRLWREDPRDLDALSGILHSLYTLVLLHCAKEEDLLTPVLEEGLLQQDAAALFAEMDAAVEQARLALPVP